MKNEITEEFLKELLTWLKESKSFVSEQAPEVIQQYLLWGIVDNVGMIALAAVVITVSYFATFKWAPQDKCAGSWRFEKFITGLAGGVLSVFFGIGAIISAFTLAKILIAPKLYLLQAIGRLVK